jgi:hypothetical protein
VEHVEWDGAKKISVNRETDIHFDRVPQAVHFSDYTHGDVYYRLDLPPNGRARGDCRVGMATLAARFPADAGGRSSTHLRIPLEKEARKITLKQAGRSSTALGRGVEVFEAQVPTSA